MQPETAAIIIIGNEILSGKTQDINVNYIANELNNLGVALREVRIIPDEPQIIITVVNHLRSLYDYVFTTGGIGPTHDDITSECVAKAFNDDYILNQKALEQMQEFMQRNSKEYKDTYTRMAYMPKSAIMLMNRETGAPGFKMENVFVMAGVPFIMQAMFKEAKKYIKPALAIISKTIDIYLSESVIAEDFRNLQNKYPSIEMGSYPFKNDDNKWGTTLSLRGNQYDLINKAMDELIIIIDLLRNSTSSLKEENCEQN